MHVLTKIFIVLVSLLAVLLVPLVVVYAHNENSFKSRFQSAELATATARMAKEAAEASAGAEKVSLNNTILQLTNDNIKLQNEKTAAEVTVRQLESQLATVNATQGQVVADVKLIKSSLEASQQLTESLVAETRALRNSAVALEKQKVELDEALRDVTSQLDVAEQARRALAEELARVKDEHSKTLTALNRAVAMGFNPAADVRAGALGGGISPDKTLTAKVIRIERSAGRILAEIDAGSRDGVKEGWSMTIANGGDFIANLRIVNVDVNRATGIITLEDSKRGEAKVGNTAHAFAGQN